MSAGNPNTRVEPSDPAGGERVAGRLRAIGELETLGPGAGAPLAAFLSDRELAVRIAAAEALGRVGNEAAAPALLEALRGRHTGGSGRWHRWAGVLGFLGLWPLGLALVMGPWAVQIAAAAALVGWVVGPISHITRRRAHRVFADATGKALESIARRQPSGQLGAVADGLKALAADQLQQSAEARRASERAARRIEALVGARRSLPIAEAEPPAVDLALPLPVAAESESLDLSLPRAAADGEVVRLQGGPG